MDRIDLKRIVEDLVGLEEIAGSHNLDIVDYQDKEWIDDRSKLVKEFDDEQQQPYEQVLTNLRHLGVAERNDIRSKGNQCHDSGRRSRKGNCSFPASNLNLLSVMRSTETSMDMFVREVGVAFTHTEKL